MPDATMTFDAVVRREHFAELVARSRKRFGRSRLPAYQGIAFLAAIFLVAFSLMQLIGSVALPIDRTAWLGPTEVVLLAFVSGTLLAQFLMWLMSRTINAGYIASALRDGGIYLGSRRYSLDDEGIKTEGSHGRWLTHWSAMMELTEAPSTFLLWTDPGAAVMVPKDAFKDEPARAAFVEFVKNRIQTREHA